FHLKYESKDAIKWYTNDSFVYRLLNKALRTDNIELLYTFRYYINDLCSHINELYQQQTENTTNNIIVLYRGQHMTVMEIEKLQNNINNLISTNGFFSTTRDPAIARIFAEHDQNLNDGLVSVFIHIEIDLNETKTSVFTDIEQFSLIPDEREVIFNISSVFIITSLNYD
ncbi:unnamed protein product, partial [Didymodactylos carnosus]